LDNLTVMGTEVPHYEKVRANATMPYLVNGRVSMSPRPYTPGGGYEGSQQFEVQVDAFSNYDGDKEVDALRDKVVTILMTNRLSLGSGYVLTNRSLDNSFTLTEDEGEIRHGVVEVTHAVQIL